MSNIYPTFFADIKFIEELADWKEHHMFEITVHK